MPRTARKKSEECIYHIMSRSISEINLFQCNEDRARYLELLKRYMEKNHCKVYAYILMDNHVHIFINPCGYDISSFMRALNTAYVTYFNKRYNRHGHLFQGRFASTIVDNDIYGLTLSAYIHNNAKDLPGYAGKEEVYQYSSYGIYTGARKDIYGIVETGYLLSLFCKETLLAKQKLRSFTISMRETGILREVDNNIVRAYMENEYRSEKHFLSRRKTPDELMRKIVELFGESLQIGLRLKNSKETSKDRAFIVYTLRTLCGYTYKQICEYVGNISMSGVSRLSSEGFKLLKEHGKYRKAFGSLIQAS